MRDFLTQTIEAITKRTDGLGNKDWTRALHARLARFAKEHGCLLYPEARPYKGEYLVDFCLYDGQKGAILACESQLYPPFGGDSKNLEGIEWAFDKLRGVKAPFKVLIFEAVFEEYFPKSIHDALVNSYIRPYEGHSKQERYIFVQLDGDKTRVYQWRPSSDSRQTESTDYTFKLTSISESTSDNR